MSNNTAELEALYAQACDLVQQERIMLDKDDIDALEDLTQERENIMKTMWSMRATCDEKYLLQLLQKLQQAQEQLITLANEEQATLRGHLKLRKKQSGYFVNAQKQVAHRDKAFYMNKVS